MEKVGATTSHLGAAGNAFALAVSRQAYRLMAYKDEYEVARLCSEPGFRAAVDAQFSRTGKIRLHLAPPLLSRLDPRTGRPAKRRFGPWIFTAMALLAKGKRLRSEEHTSELQSLMRNSYAVFCLKKKNTN